MADAIHEFSSDDNLTYADITNGHTVATTTGSQTGVVRDIAVTIPGEKSVDFKVDDITVARAGGSVAISGTLLMKASQTLKMFPADFAYYTGLKWPAYDGGASGNATYMYADIQGVDNMYKLPPDYQASTDDRLPFTTAKYGLYTGTNTYVTNKTNGAVTTSGISAIYADGQFGKPTGDFYYTEYLGSAKGSNGYNHLKYYDYSTDTVTELMDSDSSYYNWDGGFTNKYLILVDNNPNFSKFKTFDTSTNTLSSNITLKRSNNGNATTIYVNNNMVNYSCLDNYCLIKTDNSNTTNDKFMIMRLSDGRSQHWLADDSLSTSTSAIRSNQSHQQKAALARNSKGIYYMLWPFARGSSSGNFGLQIFKFGTAADIDAWLTHQTYGFTASKAPQMVSKWLARSGGEPYWNQYSFTINNNNSRKGMQSGFFPLKQPTPTDSTSRYWVFLCHQSGDPYMIDLDNIKPGSNSYTGASGTNCDGMITKFHFNKGDADEPSMWSDGWPGESASFMWNPSYLAEAYGTIKQRTTGILTT